MLIWRLNLLKHIHNFAKHMHFIHKSFLGTLPAAQRIVESVVSYFILKDWTEPR